MREEIMLDAVENQKAYVTLGDQECLIMLYQRGIRMFMDLMCNREYVFRGQICVESANLAWYKANPFLGELWFEDTQGQCSPQWQELGTRYRLFYIPEEKKENPYYVQL